MKFVFWPGQRASRRFWPLSLMSLLFLNFVSLSLAPFTASSAHAAPLGAGWQGTGAKIPADAASCIDGSQPDTLLYSRKDSGDGENAGTYALNWRTGQKTTVSATPFEVCDPYTGLLFAKEGAKVRRFSTRDPQGRLVDYAPQPQYFPKDGSQQYYIFDYSGGGQRLISSSDGGLTWQPRSQAVKGFYDNLVVSLADARSLYLANCEYNKDCTILFSADAGITWEKRSVNAVNSTAVGIEPVGGPATPVNYMLARLYSTAHRVMKLSTDGGRTFVTLGEFGANDSPSGRNPGEDIHVYYTGQKLVRYSVLTSGITLSESVDGQTWTNLAFPFATKPAGEAPIPVLSQLPNTPNSFVVMNPPSGGQANMWLTTDGGHTWNNLGAGRDNWQFTPYLPTGLVSVNAGGQVEVQPFSQPDKQATARVTANNSAGSRYFGDTGHNLAGPIRRFWEANGGLAQFGYPQTETVREFNPADGKVYVVQYFERNRLEYHPELAGTKYEVLLGLLGNQLTEGRRSEGPFKPIANPNAPGFTYFQPTGHTLAHTFKEYWEANGGLALYGYPISEEFQEVNPDDGKTYVVQYFERNRFEYHPENKGTRYEVLLGLLGNTLLKQKGWL